MARKKRKRTPEEIEAALRSDRQTAELLHRVWERMEYHWEKIVEQAEREGREPPFTKPERPVWAGPEPDRR